MAARTGNQLADRHVGHHLGDSPHKYLHARCAAGTTHQTCKLRRQFYNPLFQRLCKFPEIKQQADRLTQCSNGPDDGVALWPKVGDASSVCCSPGTHKARCYEVLRGSPFVALSLLQICGKAAPQLRAKTIQLPPPNTPLPLRTLTVATAANAISPTAAVTMPIRRCRPTQRRSITRYAPATSAGREKANATTAASPRNDCGMNVPPGAACAPPAANAEAARTLPRTRIRAT